MFNIPFSLNICESFKTKYSFEARCNEVNNILRKYPDRIPVICEKLKKDQPDLDKVKYLVPWDLTLGQFIWVIRQRMKLKSEEALYITINGSIFPTSSVIGYIYNDNKDADGFLYLIYTKENTFGYSF